MVNIKNNNIKSNYKNSKIENNVVDNNGENIRNYGYNTLINDNTDNSTNTNLQI